MVNIVLGLLLLDPLTIYEMRSFISQNLQSICSDSMGSIQAAIKKLLESNQIYFEEKVENGVNKKRYFITDQGKKEFTKWVEQPMIPGKTKNMELSKLFFMNTISKEKRITLIDEYLSALHEERSYLEKIAKTSFNDADEAMNDSQFITLQYGIELTLFEINFFEKVKRNLKK